MSAKIRVSLVLHNFECSRRWTLKRTLCADDNDGSENGVYLRVHSVEGFCCAFSPLFRVSRTLRLITTSVAYYEWIERPYVLCFLVNLKWLIGNESNSHLFLWHNFKWLTCTNPLRVSERSLSLIDGSFLNRLKYLVPIYKRGYKEINYPDLIESCGSQFFLIQSINYPENHQFFNGTRRFFEVSESSRTTSSLILIFSSQIPRTGSSTILSS